MIFNNLFTNINFKTLYLTLPIYVDLFIVKYNQGCFIIESDVIKMIFPNSNFLQRLVMEHN